MDRISVKLLLHSHWGEQVSCPRYPDWVWGVFSGSGGCFTGVRRLRNVSRQLTTSSANVKNELNFNFCPPYYFTASTEKNSPFVIIQLLDAACPELLAGSLNVP
jgi:hypothetical protein